MPKPKINPKAIAEVPPPPEKDKEQTNTLFKALMEKLALYREEDNTYAMVDIDGAPHLYRLRSDAFLRFLKAFAYEHNGRGIGQTTTSDMLDTLEAMAFKNGQPCKVNIRFAQRDGVVYLDLCNDAWQVVAVTSEGWNILTSRVPLFTRAKRMRPLPLPTQGGNSEALWQFFNLPEERDRILLRTWLLTALLGEGTNTVVIFHGEQGSAKSTSTRLLRALIDPNQSDLRALPRDERDLFIAAQSNAVLAFDNMSGISKPMSDALCRIVYGGGYSTRKLHSNDEEMLLEAKSNLILNGIDDIASRQDLIERAVIITLPPIPAERRKPEEVFQREFIEAHPRLLGALLDDLAKVLRYLPHTPTSNLPRMTTFARVGMALMMAEGHPPEAFLSFYRQNSLEAVDVGLEAEPVAEAVMKFMKDRSYLYRSPMGSFYHELGHANQNLRDAGYGWPKTSHHLSGIIRRLMPALRHKGLDIRFERKEQARWILIEKKELAK